MQIKLVQNVQNCCMLQLERSSRYARESSVQLTPQWRAMHISKDYIMYRCYKHNIHLLCFASVMPEFEKWPITKTQVATYFYVGREMKLEPQTLTCTHYTGVLNVLTIVNAPGTSGAATQHTLCTTAANII